MASSIRTVLFDFPSAIRLSRYEAASSLVRAAIEYFPGNLLRCFAEAFSLRWVVAFLVGVISARYRLKAASRVIRSEPARQRYTPRTISSSVLRAQSVASRLVRKVLALVGHPCLRIMAFQEPESVLTNVAMQPL